MKEFSRGLTFWLRGWSHLMARPRLLMIAAIPLAISLAAAATAIYYIYSFLPAWTTEILQIAAGQVPWLAEWLYYPIMLLATLLILAGGIFTAYIVQSLIAIPFYGFLVSGVLREKGVKAGNGSIVHMLMVGLIKAFIFIFCGVGFFFMSFIPLFNAISLIGPLLLISFDLIDYSFEVSGFGLRQRIGYMLRRKGLWLGMAAGLGLTLIIPGLTLLVAPGAVVGAALVFADSAERI